TLVHGFVADSPAALRDAFLVAGAAIRLHHLQDGEAAEPVVSGSLESRIGQDDTRAIAVGFEPALELNEAEFVRHIAKILAYFREHFGNLGPASVYVRQVPGDVSEQRGVGRRGGFVVEFPAAHSQPAAPHAGARTTHQQLDAQTLL